MFQCLEEKDIKIVIDAMEEQKFKYSHIEYHDSHH